MKYDITASAAAMLAIAFVVLLGSCLAGENAPSDHSALLRQASAALKNNDYGQVIEATETVLEADPDNASALMLLGAATFGLGEVEKARPILERATVLDPNTAVNYKLLGDSWKHENLALARQYWDKSLVLAPDIPEFYSHAAWPVIYSGDLDGGMDYLRPGSTRFPDNRSILLARAYVMWRAKMLDRVLKIYQRLLELDNTDREVVARAVMLAVVNDDMETAEMGLKHLEQLGGDDRFLLLASGFYHIATDEHDKAIAEYSALLDRDLLLHDRYQVLHNLGALMGEAKRPAEARDLLIRSLDLLLENPGLDATLSRWNQNTLIGLFSQELGDNEEALRRYAASVESGYGNSSAYVRYATLTYHGGDAARALDILAAGREKFPDDFLLVSQTARILVGIGQTDDARKYLQAIVESSPEDPGCIPEDVEWAAGLLKGKVAGGE